MSTNLEYALRLELKNEKLKAKIKKLQDETNHLRTELNRIEPKCNKPPKGSREKCALPSGHDGFHQSKDGHRVWRNQEKCRLCEAMKTRGSDCMSKRCVKARGGLSQKEYTEKSIGDLVEFIKENEMKNERK